MKKNLVFVLLLFPFLNFAQLTENFTDGDFTNNPTWVGDAGNFNVNASQQLQLNAAAAGTSYLAIPASVASLDNTEWQCYIRLNFSPSSQNYGRVYLTSDQSNLIGPLNGYYLQFGESLSNDAIELFKQTGTTSTSVARGTNGFVANSFTIRVKITRDNAGLWSIYADPAAGTSFQMQATGTDATFNSSSFSGVVCTYTSGNITGFYFDDFSIGPIVVDVTPPSVSSINVINQNTIDIIFDEAVEQISAETIFNYTVSGNNPTSATLTSANTVRLTFAGNFSDGVTNTLSVLNVKDLNNNAISTASTGQFTYFAPVTATKYDVVINEFMPDPDPQIGLPNAEYVEIYNRSNKTFDLNGWKISDNGSPHDLSSFVLTPGAYLILCSTTDAASFASYGNVLGVVSFPALNNATTTTGDDIVIYDNNSILIDKISYDASWYHDASKQDGGWSIERIDPDFTCSNSLNWKASLNSNGGTPGTVNSVDATFSDSQNPTLLRALVMDPTHVKVFFDETMNETIISTASTYSIDNSIGTTVSVSVTSDFTSATLTLLSTIQRGIIYKLTVLSSISDCAGNTLSGNNTVRFAIPDTATISDIIINEILFNPFPDEPDFVELYNRSQKIIDLSSLRIANTNLANDSLDVVALITGEGFLVFPGDYVALTESPDIVKTRYTTNNPAGFVKVPALPSFNDDKDAVVITNGSFTRIDQFNYSADFQFPLLNDPEGVSLERISFNRPTQDSTNWHSAAETVGFATPAYENSQHAEVVDDGSEVTVEPEIFSPDNDSQSDVVNVHYHFEASGYTANLKIYDSKGRLVIHLVKSQLLGTAEGTFSWDGVNDENEKASVGIYVAYLEVFTASGNVKKYKKPIVLASKL